MAKISIKICGITLKEQAETIGSLGVDYLGFIIVPHTPRYVSPVVLPELTRNLEEVKKVGVFRDYSIQEINKIVTDSSLDCIQLHGQESLVFCQQIKKLLPDKMIIKAIGIKDQIDLETATEYSKFVDIILLDGVGGGTGKTIDWQMLKGFQSHCPWWLAGGINPDNAKEAMDKTNTKGLDLSSGVEDAPGIKNIVKIKSLLSILD